MIQGPPEVICDVADSAWRRLMRSGGLLDAFVVDAPEPGRLASSLALRGEMVVLGDAPIGDGVSVSLREWRSMSSPPLSDPRPLPPVPPEPPGGPPVRGPVTETDSAVLRRLYPGAVWSD